MRARLLFERSSPKSPHRRSLGHADSRPVPPSPIVSDRAPIVPGAMLRERLCACTPIHRPQRSDPVRFRPRESLGPLERCHRPIVHLTPDASRFWCNENEEASGVRWCKPRARGDDGPRRRSTNLGRVMDGNGNDRNAAPSEIVAGLIVDELIRCGTREAVVCPGSRSAPLARALLSAERAGRLRLHVRADERSATFLALGLAAATGSVTPVAVTSGTAVAKDRKSTRLNSSHSGESRMPSSA